MNRYMGVVLAVVLAGGAGCSGQQAPAADASSSGALRVEAAWSRAVPPEAPVAAGFMTIANGTASDDRLREVRSAAAERVEIHEVRHEDGMARMRELADGLAVAAGQRVALEPGGYHLMFIAPGDGFVAGGRVEATLVFEQAGEVPVAFEVRPVDGATDTGHDGHDHGH